ncbi:Gfo/Idh/MocA family protein [Verrucomicrobiota bacterium]
MKRRDFIKTAVAASTVYSLLPHSVIGANNQINVGIIGMGKKGGLHFRHFNNMQDVNVTAICDPDTAHLKLKKENDTVTKYQDMRKLLEQKEIDAVVIVTPNHWHSLAAILACQAGKHVYVEKPVSHSISEGRKMVEAARKYNRIVQAGTQHRSCPSVQKCAKDIQAGVYGKVLWAHCSKLSINNRNPIGMIEAPVDPPSTCDYELWAGPAPKTPIMRKNFHYDWHWQWNWGDGEMGNWGIHYIDDLRHILGWDDIPSNVISAGNRWWKDNGETPNMFFAIMEHKGVKVVIDIRNMPHPKYHNQAAVYLGSHGGNYIQCENGFIRIARGGGHAYDNDGNKVKKYSGNGGANHGKNFIEAIRQNKRELLNCDIEIGHLSTTMCHQANISYRIGQSATQEEVRANMNTHEDAANTLNSILEQLEGQADLKTQPFVLGPKLTFDNKTEQFTGDNAKRANVLAKGSSRKEFPVPEIV